MPAWVGHARLAPARGADPDPGLADHAAATGAPDRRLARPARGIVTPAEASSLAARPPALSDPEPGVELGQPRPAHAEHGAAAQPQAGVSGRLRLDRGDPSEVDDRRAMDPAEPR